TPGVYRVSATWPFDPQYLVTDTHYTVSGGASPVSVLVNQQLLPNDFTVGGVGWKNLTTSYTITGGTITVTLTDETATPGQYIYADAIRVGRIGNLPGPPAIQVQDGLTDIPDGTGSVSFGTTPVGTSVTKVFTVRNAGSANLTLGPTITLPAGFTLAL